MKKKEKNVCWIDYLQKCPFKSEMGGFKDASPICGNCSQIDPENFYSLLEYAFGKTKFIDKFIKDREDNAREEGRKEGRAEERESYSQKKKK